MSQFFASGGQSIGVSASASVLPINIQDWFPLDWLVWSTCCPRDSQEYSPAPQFKSIRFSVLSLLYSPTLTSICDYWKNHQFRSAQSLSHVRLFATPWTSMPGLPVHHQLPEFTQTHVHWVSDAILCHPLLLLPSVFPVSGSFPVIVFSHQVAKVLELQLQHQSFQWIFRVDFL